MQPDADRYDGIEPRPARWVLPFAAAAVATAVVVLVLASFVALRGFGPASSAPRRFDHSVWVSHQGPRQAMLTDLLRHTICPGTSYERVIALLGRPDSLTPDPAIPNEGDVPLNLEYDVGSFGMFYVEFERGRRGQVVLQVSPPPSADAWPDTGCWT